MISIPHPVDSWRRSALGEAATLKYIDQVDALEVFNARCLVSDDNDSAKALAKRYGKLMTAGSDAHTADEVGNGYLLLPPFADNAASFREPGAGAAGGATERAVGAFSQHLGQGAQYQAAQLRASCAVRRPKRAHHPPLGDG
ncbi:MAG: PHP domain-containing protein [Anaerolineae bacterium]|nr:MAG: PHP domain-containing protein [Anaerolineae bacterium]